MEVKVDKVKSSIISKLDFDGSKNELVVVFTTGSSYKYKGVSTEQFVEILGAESIGGRFNKLKSEFEYEKLS